MKALWAKLKPYWVISILGLAIFLATLGWSIIISNTYLTGEASQRILKIQLEHERKLREVLDKVQYLAEQAKLEQDRQTVIINNNTKILQLLESRSGAGDDFLNGLPQHP